MGFFPRDFHPGLLFPDEFFPGDFAVDPPETINFWPNGFFPGYYWPQGFFPGEVTPGGLRIDILSYRATVYTEDAVGEVLLVDATSVPLGVRTYRSTITADSIVNQPSSIDVDIQTYRAVFLSSNTRVDAATVRLDVGKFRQGVTSRVYIYPATISFDISVSQQNIYAPRVASSVSLDVEIYPAEVEGLSALWEYQRPQVTEWEPA